MTNEVKLINPHELETTAGTQARVAIKLAMVEEYAAAMKAGDLFPSPVVFAEKGSERYILADGFHTREAWIATFKDKPIPCDVREGKIWDAKIYAAGANAAHGQRRSAKDIENAVRMLLLDPNSEGFASTIIADMAKCHRKTVAKVRDKMICKGELNPDESRKRKYMREGKEVEITVPPKKDKPRAGKKTPATTERLKTQDEFEREAIIEAIGMLRTVPCSGGEALERYGLDGHVEAAERAESWLHALVSASRDIDELSESEKAFLSIV